MPRAMSASDPTPFSRRSSCASCRFLEFSHSCGWGAIVYVQERRNWCQQG